MLRGEFIEGSSRLFCTVRLPEANFRRTVMVVPAFGEEMNKTRRMLAVLATELNRRHIALLIPDLSCTGDSDGTFAEAAWSQWVDDLRTVLDWAAEQGLVVSSLLGIRTGALLSAQVADVSNRFEATVLWQPVKFGRVFVQQMLRTRTVGGVLKSKARETVEELLARIRNGETVQVGGYALTERVVNPLISLELNKLVSDRLGRLRTIEVGAQQEHSSNELFGELPVETIRLPGIPYWSAAEIVVDHNVVARTVQLLDS